ncbi:MAG TPA: hypothetical protein VFE25_01130 [Opitutaceae bacterium]|jgi:hypothetical protein|nr:hypothetical protein [Opitutaceae bacterium]
MTPTFPDRPFVGQLGRENTLQVLSRPDRIICRVTRGSVWFSQLILLFFGSFLAFVVWTAHQDRSFRMPLPFLILVWVLALACWGVFLRTLAGMARIEIVGDTGNVLFFRYNTRIPRRVVRRSEIRRIGVETQMYTSRSVQTANYLLSLHLEGDVKVPLCASPSEREVRLLETQLTTGIRMQKTPGDARA